MEERLGRECQLTARQRKGTEEEGRGKVKATELKSFQIYT